mmetsp:Transcript_20485/g.28321  ORF Transcript_20485/g.28321 Transcript_20485/m.28321 type:complete len:84 (-) Transcript_20485:690-941(-)
MASQCPRADRWPGMDGHELLWLQMEQTPPSLPPWSNEGLLPSFLPSTRRKDIIMNHPSTNCTDRTTRPTPSASSPGPLFRPHR